MEIGRDARFVMSDETDNHGNRTVEYSCGCIGTSGGGAYGTRGSAWAWDECPWHTELAGGWDDESLRRLRRRVEDTLRKDLAAMVAVAAILKITA